jgi:hypothetical protein
MSRRKRIAVLLPKTTIRRTLIATATAATATEHHLLPKQNRITMHQRLPLPLERDAPSNKWTFLHLPPNNLPMAILHPEEKRPLHPTATAMIMAIMAMAMANARPRPGPRRSKGVN